MIEFFHLLPIKETCHELSKMRFDGLQKGRNRHRQAALPLQRMRLQIYRRKEIAESPRREKTVRNRAVHGRNAFLHTAKKKYCRVWIAVDRLEKRILHFVVGCRGTKTGAKLWRQMKTRTVRVVATNRRKAYSEFLPPTKHVKSKAETYTVEGYNSLVRHYPARFRRKTKCYTKSFEMLYYSLLLLFAKLNGEIAIF